MTDRWSDELDSLRQRLGDLIDGSRLGDRHREIAAEALEELAVAIEELQTQNNELVAGHADLELERRRFRDLFETMPDGYAITDVNGIVTEANTTLCELLGADRSRLVGRPLASHIAPDDQRAFYNLVNRVNRAVERGTLSINLGVRDHQLVPVNLRATTTHDGVEGDRSIRWLIHDRRRELASADLRESEERLRVLFDTADIGVVLSDTEGQVLFANPFAVDLVLGGSDREVAESTWLSRIPIDDRHRVEGRLDAARRGVRSDAERHRVITPDGTTRWVDHGIIPFREADGSISGVVSTFTDATAEQLALTELRRNRDFMAATLDTVDAIVIAVDPAGRIRLFNRTAEAITGWTSAETIGKSIVDVVFPPESHAPAQEILSNAATGHHARSEHDWLNRDGSRCRVAWTTAELHSTDGEVEAVIVTGTDVTEQRRLEADIAQAARLHSIGRLASGIAHDFNNSLAVMLARVDRVADRSTDPATLADLDGIRRTIDRSSSMIADLLTFSGRQTLYPVPCDLNTELRRMTDPLSALVGDDIHLVLELTDEPGPVLIDPGRFEQVMANLAINARDAMPGGGTLTIGTTIEHRSERTHATGRSNAQVHVTVTDTGSGIDPTVLPHVFEPYFTTKDVGRGSGIGLAMAYGIVRQSNGSIAVDRTSPRGTRFSLWFPATTDPGADAPAAGEAPGGDDPDVAGRTSSVLVVEDDAELRSLLVDALRDAGHLVAEAEDGPSALELLDAPIDLLITDIDLPETDGITVAAAFTDHRRSLPVLFISGTLTSDARTRLPDGAHFLAKPLHLPSFTETVRRMTNRS